MPEATNPTAALIVIGDEILSGRTKDVNIGATADFCTDLAIDLMEVRVVPDDGGVPPAEWLWAMRWGAY